jgi:hypothetical protein
MLGSHGDPRAKGLESIASGALPADPAPVERPAPTSTPGNRPSRILVGGVLHEPCTVCGDPGPQVQYFYIAGQVVSVHTAQRVRTILAKCLPVSDTPICSVNVGFDTREDRP